MNQFIRILSLMLRPTSLDKYTVRSILLCTCGLGHLEIYQSETEIIFVKYYAAMFISLNFYDNVTNMFGNEYRIFSWAIIIQNNEIQTLTILIFHSWIKIWWNYLNILMKICETPSFVHNFPKCNTELKCLAGLSRFYQSEKLTSSQTIPWDQTQYREQFFLTFKM